MGEKWFENGRREPARPCCFPVLRPRFLRSTRLSTRLYSVFAWKAPKNVTQIFVLVHVGAKSLVDLRKRSLKTGKQHGLSGSRRPFSNHFSPTSDVKTLRLNPLKKIRFRSRFGCFPANALKPWFWSRISCEGSGTHRFKMA